MSDFLASLAARAVSPVPAIRPAIRSPYEPPTVAESNWIEPVTASMPIEATPTAPWNPVRNQPLAQTPEMLAGPTVRENLTPLLPGVSPEVSSLIAASGPTFDPPPPLHAIPPPLRAPLEPMTKRSKRAQPAAAPAARPGPPPASPTAVRPGDVPMAAMSAKAPAAFPLPHPDCDIKHVRPGVKSSGEAPRDRSLPAAPIPVLHAAQPSPAAAEDAGLHLRQRSPLLAAAIPLLPDEPPSRPATAQAPPPAPEVNITIGRVEIRAGVPAAQLPAPAPRGPGPHLSLDAFLRRNASRPA